MYSSFLWENLARIYSGVNNDEIKRNLLDYVWGQMRIYGERSPPVLKNLAASRFIASRKVEICFDKLQNVDGFLDVGSEGFKIFLRQTLHENPSRLRTVVAHELGHTFLFDINSKPITPLFSKQDSQNPWKAQEGLAYEIGRNILIPRQMLKVYCNLPQSIASFAELKKTFRTTSSVLARQLVSESFWDVYLFWTEFDKKASNYIIPKRNWRFKSKLSFSNMNLDLHWNYLQQKIAGKDSVSLQTKLGRKDYHFEAYRPPDSAWMTCLLMPEKDYRISKQRRTLFQPNLLFRDLNPNRS
jgi:Zn-dependent peptidase ImmA (M78 family)